MVKVKCVVCGDIGYTASPGRVACKCGGRLKVVAEDAPNEKVVLDEKTVRLFDFSDLLNL